MQKGVAEKVVWAELTEEHLKGKIRKMLDDKSYKENVNTLSSLFRDQPVSPLERAIWWIEWTMRHPNVKHMQHVGHTFTFIQLQSIDVLFVIFTIILLTIWMMVKCVCLARKFFQTNGNNENGKRKKMN